MPHPAAPSRVPTTGHFSAARHFPATRMRRPRSHDWSRRMVAEHRLGVDDLIWPIFLQDADGETPIATLPGVSRMGGDVVIDRIATAVELGIPAVAPFPATDASLKTDDAREAFNPDNLVCRTVRKIRQAFGDSIGVITDVALDPYSVHGQDGLVRDGVVVNDETLDALSKQARTLADAGADVVAPSDMMDGRVAAIRSALDDAGHPNVMILSYAAKYASAFYGPFRDAVGSAANLGSGDKKTYQQSPVQSDEALHEVALDIAEGADMVMIKPGMPYLDIVRRVKDAFGVPTMAYQVSGEYAMIRAASDAGALDHRAAVMESLMAFKRAGADAVLTYFAVDAARWLSE